MLERDSEYFSKYAVDPNLDDYFEGFEFTSKFEHYIFLDAYRPGGL